MAIKKNTQMADTGTSSASKRTAPYYDYNTTNSSGARGLSKGSEVAPMSGGGRGKATVTSTATTGANKGAVAVPQTVPTTSAAERSANANTSLNKFNTVNEYADGGWYGGDTNALAQVYENANVPYTPSTSNDTTSLRGSSGGGSGYSSGGSGSAVVDSIVNAITVDPTKALRDRYANMLDELSGNHNTMLNALRQNYDSAVNTVNNNYNLSEQAQNANAEDALRQAYINYMISKKNMASDMSRMGYNGGVTESNQARMYNNYGNIRNDINRTLADRIAEINAKRNADLSDVLASYNTNVANQEKNYFNERTNIQQALSKALAAMGY